MIALMLVSSLGLGPMAPLQELGAQELAARELHRPSSGLLEAREGFETQILGEPRQRRELPEPPPELFSLVEYESPLGPMQAYLHEPEPSDELLPAIVWLTGGHPTARGGAYIWGGTPDNDQSASAYRQHGVAMLFPTVRGTALNPGVQESFFGEVEDVIAAAEFLQSLEFVDPDRLYLGGHSTGGTLALLVAESTAIFDAVFAFGPASRAEHYGTMTFDPSDPEEYRLRSPIHFLSALRSPTWVIEGQFGRAADLRELAEASDDPMLRCLEVPGADHFSLLSSVNDRLARRVMQCARETEPFSVEAETLLGASRSWHRSWRRAQDRLALQHAGQRGLPLDEVHWIVHEFHAGSRPRLEEALVAFVEAGFRARLEDVIPATEDEPPSFVLRVRRAMRLDEAETVLALSEEVAELAHRHGLPTSPWQIVEPAPRDDL